MHPGTSSERYAIHEESRVSKGTQQMTNEKCQMTNGKYRGHDLVPDCCIVDFRFRFQGSLRIGRTTKNKTTAKASPPCPPRSQSLGVARRAKRPPTSTPRAPPGRSAPLLEDMV